MQQCRLFFRNSLWHLTKQTHINLSVFTKEWLWFLLGVQNAACELASVVWNCCASLDVAGDPQRLQWVCSCQQVKDLTRTHKPFKHETMNQSVAKASQFDRRLLRLGSFTWRSNFSSVVRVDGEDVVSVANFAKNKTTSKLVHCVVRLLVQNKSFLIASVLTAQSRNLESAERHRLPQRRSTTLLRRAAENDDGTIVSTQIEDLSAQRYMSHGVVRFWSSSYFIFG